MNYKRKIFITLFFITFLALPFQVLADEKGSPNHHEDQNSVDEQQLNGKQEKLNEVHDNKEILGSDQEEEVKKGDVHNDIQEATHKEESGHGTDEHGYEDDDHHSYEEPGPNYPILGTFAAINGVFLLYGAVQKSKTTKRRKSGVK